ncbi:MAG TPA: hypothetical protein VGM07_06755 [Stellaceae bacterium]|jgi:hypothetical protein
MRRGRASGVFAAALISAAAPPSTAAMAADAAPQSGRWQWLARTYWYVPAEYLLAIASSPALKAPVPVSDQTVYYISHFAGGYFWGTTAVSYTRTSGAPASDAVSCLQLVGSVTPEGAVHLTFTPLGSKSAPSGSTSQSTVGVGTMTRQRYQWTMENQMSTVAVGSLLLSHWAYMYQCKPSEPCFAELPGVGVSVPDFLAPCAQAPGGG